MMSLFRFSQGLALAQAYNTSLQILPSSALWTAVLTCGNTDVLHCFVNIDACLLGPYLHTYIQAPKKLGLLGPNSHRSTTSDR